MCKDTINKERELVVQNITNLEQQINALQQQLSQAQQNLIASKGAVLAFDRLLSLEEAPAEVKE